MRIAGNDIAAPIKRRGDLMPTCICLNGYALQTLVEQRDIGIVELMSTVNTIATCNGAIS